MLPVRRLHACAAAAGKTVYFGDTFGALDHFERAGLPCPQHRNPADHFLHAVNTDFVSDEQQGGQPADEEAPAAGKGGGGHLKKKEDINAQIQRLVDTYDKVCGRRLCAGKL